MLQFSDTTNYNGLIQRFELRIGGESALGSVSGNTIKLKLATVDFNIALDDYNYLAIEHSGMWQWDDFNHSKYPIIKANIVASQRDYSFTTDEQGYYILDIYKVAILTSATATLYTDIEPVDEQDQDDSSGFINESTTTGIPTKYGKTANGIFFDVLPNYAATSGIKLYTNREANHFISSDTTKVPGIPQLHADYLPLRAAELYAQRNSLADYPSLRAERLQMEENIKGYFGRREKDVRHIMRMQPINFR